MKISEEYAGYLANKAANLEKENKALKSDLEFVKRCLFLALQNQGNRIVLGDSFAAITEPGFAFEENIGGQAILRAVLK